MVTKHISLDVWTKNYVTVYANRGEIDARYIEASFKGEDGSNISLSDKTVTFYALKPDGTQIYNSCTVNTTNNTATVELTSQTLASPGILNCEFQIVGSSGSLLLKATGLRIVVSSDTNFSEAIESTSEFNALLSTIETAESIGEYVGDLEDLTTTEKGSTVGAINELKSKMAGTVLYSNADGSRSTITLSDSSGNYDYIDIFLREGFTGRIYNPNGHSMQLMNAKKYTDGNTRYIEFWIVNIVFSGNQITFNNGGLGVINSGRDIGVYDGDYNKIVRVVGYKY